MENSSEDYFRYLFDKYEIDIRVRTIKQFMYSIAENKGFYIDAKRNEQQNVEINLDDIDKADVENHYNARCMMRIDDKDCFVSVYSYQEIRGNSKLILLID